MSLMTEEIRFSNLYIMSGEYLHILVINIKGLIGYLLKSCVTWNNTCLKVYEIFLMTRIYQSITA